MNAPRASASRAVAVFSDAAAEVEDSGISRVEQVAKQCGFDHPELRLSPAGEELADLQLYPTLDHPVGFDGPSSEPLGDFGGDRRLPCAHEADEREVPVECVQRH